ncbi:MAG: prepilin-type N-terminal cleavage/methylation domain-containing protein [Planctomycetota bacterium]
MKRRSGLTLIEILIAIIILTVGVVSILSIFPFSVKTASSSVEDTVAAKIAESVADALNIAMRTSTAENVATNTPGRAYLVHDGVEGGNYEFALPLPETPPPANPRFFKHPTTGTFNLGTDEFIGSVLKDVWKGPDPSDPYDQYKFTFTIKRMDDDRAVGDPTYPLFQFAIAVYRFRSDDPRYADELPQPAHVFLVIIGGK